MGKQVGEGVEVTKMEDSSTAETNTTDEEIAGTNNI